LKPSTYLLGKSRDELPATVCDEIRSLIAAHVAPGAATAEARSAK
jgi:hypothetical protein